ncbi:MAG: response regulator [Planctomycetes bacterium]|nr:response regulator [Planctomycetota bacterium]
MAKILIVDDDLDITKALKVTLESENYSVVTACNRTEGMEKVKAERPDLVVLDVMMSTWQDGFEMARELKNDSQPIKNIPILMLTGVEGKTGIDFKSTAGDPTWCPVEGFLNKPVEPDVLLAEVKKILQK